MNGNQMLEALGYADERYIHEADRPVRRASHWKGLAAMAACFCLILLAARYALPVFQASGTKDSSREAKTANVYQAPAMGLDTGAVGEETALMDEVMSIEAAVSGTAESRSASSVSGAAMVPVSMTVRIDGREDGILLCTVLDPGTGDCIAGSQVRLLPPEAEAETEDDVSDADPAQTRRYIAVFLPADAQEEILPLLSISPEN